MRKINLLPVEDKNKFLISKLKTGLVLVAVLMVIVVAIQGAKTTKLYFELNDIKENNVEVSRLKSSIEGMREEEQKQVTVLQNIEEIRFPFYEFTNLLVKILPDEVILISLDTENMLKSIGGNSEISKTTIDDPNDSNKTIIVNSNAQIEDANGNIVGTVEPSLLPEDFYTGGGSGGKLEDIIVRGYSQNNSSIAELFYEISVLPYVKSANITAIEEKTIDGIRQNVFEFILKFN